jgi:farnesyl diphosphate synthase
METVRVSSHERRVSHRIAVSGVARDAAWARLRRASYAHYASRIPWIRFRQSRRSDDDARLELDVDVVVSRTLALSFASTLAMEWDDAARRMTVTLSSSVGEHVYRGVFDVEGEDDEVGVHHVAHVRLPTRLAAPLFDAKLERAIAHVADVVRDAVERGHTYLAPPEIVGERDAETGRVRRFRTVFDVAKAPSALWKHVRLSKLFMARVPAVAAATCEDVDASTCLLHLSLVASRRLGLAVAATLELAFDDAATTLRVRTRRCRWGAFEATVALRADAAQSHRTAVAYSSTFEPTYPLPFLDGRLRAFTEQLVDALRSSVMTASWRSDFVVTFDSLVVKPTVGAADLVAATQFDDVATHVDELLRHTCGGGKAYRALLVRLAVETLGGAVDDRVHAAGWTVELFQACALVADDIMDGSETRRGKPCWYKRVGTSIAINDALMLYATTHRVLKHHFAGDPPLFHKLACLLFDMGMQTCVGQHLDATSEGDVEHAHAARYDAIVLYKTTYYTIFHPIAMGILLCQHPNETALLANARAFCEPLGQLFQESDDYLDVYGAPERTGKIGTDVRDGKTTWLLAFALTRATDAQRAELLRLYGTADDVPRVRALFDEVGVPAEYARRQEAGAAACLAVVDSPLRPVATAILTELLHRKA